MIDQEQFQITQNFGVGGPQGSTLNLTTRVPGNAIAWRLRPDAFGGDCVSDVGAPGGVPVPGSFPVELLVDNKAFTLDNSQWQTVKARTLTFVTDGFLQGAIADADEEDFDGGGVTASDNWLVEYCTEDKDLFLAAPQKPKGVPITANFEALVQTTASLIAGPFYNDNAQCTLQNLGPNAVWLAVVGAYAAKQKPASVAAPFAAGQLLAPSGAYIYSRLPPGTGIYAICPGGNQSSGAGTRVVVVDG